MTGPVISIVVVALIGLVLVVFPACGLSGRISEAERRQEFLSQRDRTEDDNAD